MKRTRTLALVLGDQLSLTSPALQGLDPSRDAVWMAEVPEETEHVRCHKLRLVAFLSAMRHFRTSLEARGLTVHYRSLSTTPSGAPAASFADLLAPDLRRIAPARVVVVHPGDDRVKRGLTTALRRAGVAWEFLEDPRFYETLPELNAWFDAHPRPRMEVFYEHLRRKHGVLLGAGRKPAGGRWNRDAENRRPYRPGQDPGVPEAPRFARDAVTREVEALVARRFAKNPGSLGRLEVPLTRRQALRQLRHFLEHRLPHFGAYEDAMRTEEPLLFHARISFALNVGLLEARECVDGAVAAWRSGHAPIASVEGFVRQILGWREFVRGIYWHRMPSYARENALGCARERDVPWSFWDGETSMNCVRQAAGQLAETGYTHHIQRLMVLGNFAMLLGVHPRRFHDWHMAMYLDAIDWVSLPNALGMSQFGDGGIVGSKPYAASANYIHRMSNYCEGCAYDRTEVTAERACPFNALYWDFLERHRERLGKNPRMGMSYANLRRKPSSELVQIRRRADALRARVAEGDPL